MPRKLERIIEPLDDALPDLASELANAHLNAWHDWPGDRTDVDGIAKARRFIDELEARATVISTVVADLRAELARVEQLEAA